MHYSKRVLGTFLWSMTAVLPTIAQSTTTDFVRSPYKDVLINANWNTLMAQSQVTGTTLSLAKALQAAKLNMVTLAFATGECGSETWGGMNAADWAKENIPALTSAGMQYIISTGGAAGSFTCSTQAGMQTFLQRYYTSNMLGIDFDIEAGQSSEDISKIMQQVDWMLQQPQYGSLRVSFTLASLAQSDVDSGCGASLNSQGMQVMSQIPTKLQSNVRINLMVMDYGKASSSVCVLNDAGTYCDMAKSALQAVKNLQCRYPWLSSSQIEITPMIGINDDTTEVFTADNAKTLAAEAKAKGLGGLHWWSFDRDTPVIPGQTCSNTYANPMCNGTPDANQQQPVAVEMLGYAGYFLSSS